MQHPPRETFMAQEIAEIPAVLRRQAEAAAPGIERIAEMLRRRRPPVLLTIARGSSDHAALYLKYLVEILLGVPCASMGPSIASVYHSQLELPGAVAITISQSGQSPDLIALQAAARRGGAVTGRDRQRPPIPRRARGGHLRAFGSRSGAIRRRHQNHGRVHGGRGPARRRLERG